MSPGGGGRGGGMAARFGGRGGDSGGGKADIASELGLTSKATTAEFLAILRPYFWPEARAHRAAALGCFAFLAASKVSNIVAPVFIGAATDRLVRGEGVPVGELLAFAGLRFATSLFDESQRLVYLRVKEAAGHEIACTTFAHLHALSYSWHVSKRTGVVLRAVDRGVASAATVVDMLFLRLVPTVLEAAVLVYLFSTAYGSPGAGGVLAGCFVAYFAATYVLSQWRTKIRARANVADNDAAAVATDSLTGFEVVKAFSAEAYELARYGEAIKRYQAASRQTQSSIVTLNITQAAIMRAALVGVLIISAADVVRGTATLGDFVALQTWVMQLFQPLSWLGMLYTMILAAMTDMGNLAALLKEEPGVRDAPGAPALALADRGRGAAVEFRHVAFAYPASRDRVEGAMAAQRVADAAEAAQGGVVARVRRAAAAALARVAGRAGAVRLHDDGAGASDPPTSPASRSAAAGGGGGTDGAVAIDMAAAAAAAAPAPAHAGAAPQGGGAPGAPAPAASAPARAPRGPVLEDVSFTIPPGKTLAVVGATGSGKSTLSRMLFRYYDVAAGSVSVDGQDVRSVTQASLRAAIGVVPQDAVLFNDTIRYNIRYGRPDATDEEVEAAARAAQIADFVAGLKEGYDTKVGERGLKLSGGEKQRVAIARTLLKNPPILVLDEATSALDSLTEADVQGAIARARQGRTVLVIAHRLSTIRDADEILVLDGGRVVERGRHDELLARGPGGRYHALWAQQAAMTTAAAAEVAGTLATAHA